MSGRLHLQDSSRGTVVRRARDPEYRFDRLYLTHLASMLKQHYDPTVHDTLPRGFWDALLRFELARAISKEGRKP